MIALKHQQLPRVLRRAVGLLRFARTTVGANAASIFLVADADADTLTELRSSAFGGGTGGSPTRILRGVLSHWDWIRTSFASQLCDWPSVERALADGEIRTITEDDALGDEAIWFEPHGIVRTVCVPLRTSDGPAGVLFFDFDAEPSAPTDERFLADVGRRLARARDRDRSCARPEQADAA